jgi:hypothetical protein
MNILYFGVKGLDLFLASEGTRGVYIFAAD